MDYNEIKQLMEDMGNSKLTALEIALPDGTKVSMKKEINPVITASPLNAIQPLAVEAVKPVEPAKSEEKVKDNFKYIKSPMVGTFYLKPSPTAEPYVKVGDKVSKEQTVCIIEAMKLMNEIESEFDGEIVEVCVKDGEPVEYGTKLFAVK